MEDKDKNEPTEKDTPKETIMGRPRQGLLTHEEWEDFEKLCRLQCTEVEIAGWFGISEDTLNRRCKEKYEQTFAETYKKFSVDGKISLRRLQYKAARKGNATMLVWLGKQALGQRDKLSHEHGGEGGGPIKTEHTVTFVRPEKEDADE